MKHDKCFIHHCILSAPSVDLVRLCVRSSPSRLRTEEVWGSSRSRFGGTSTRQDVLDIVSSAHWLLPPLATDLKQKSVDTVRSPAHSIARLSNLTFRILPFVFRSRTPRPVPWLCVAAQLRDVSFALHCLRRLAVDCCSNHSTHFHLVPTVYTLLHRYCRLHAAAVAVTHPFVPVPESLHGGVERQHPPQTTHCYFQLLRLWNPANNYKAGPESAASGYMYRGPTDSFRPCVETGQLYVRQQGTLLETTHSVMTTHRPSLSILYCAIIQTASAML